MQGRNEDPLEAGKKEGRKRRESTSAALQTRTEDAARERPQQSKDASVNKATKKKKKGKGVGRRSNDRRGLVEKKKGQPRWAGRQNYLRNADPTTK